MKEDEARLKEIETELDALYNSYAAECEELSKTKGFNIYKASSKKKTKKIADKFAQYIFPLQQEQKRIMEKLNIEEEEERKSKYVDASVYEAKIAAKKLNKEKSKQK